MVVFSDENAIKIKNIILKHKPKRIAITLPEGMKAEFKEIAYFIESCNCEVLLIAEPCFGACDLRDYEASLLNCDLLLHFGHCSFGLKTKIKTEYIECFSAYHILPIIKKNINKLDKYKKIALCSTIQHIPELEKIKKFLEKKNKIAFIGKSNSKKIKYKGQVLGCDASCISKIEDKSDCVLFIGSGLFHALNILEKTKIPVLAVGIDKKEILDITKKRDEILKRKIIKQKKFEIAKTIGLLVSFKKGQIKKNIFEIKKKIEKKGKKVFIFGMDCISNNKIIGIDIDILVNTACPRIEEDNVFNAPVVNISDIKLL